MTHIDLPLAFLAYWVSLNIHTSIMYGNVAIGVLLFCGFRYAILQLIELKKNSLRQIAALISGAAFGMLLANTICIPTTLLATPATEAYAALTAVINLTLILFFAKLFTKYEPAILQSRIMRTGCESTSFIKILDTNALIDGRIEDLIRVKFVEGVIMIPSFVLQELKQIADHPDELKSNRGKYGLEIAKNLLLAEHVVEYEQEARSSVDESLLELARNLSAKIITADQNLIDLAAAKKIGTLNLHELAVAFQLIHLRGETLTVKITRQGERSHQGLAYTRDGMLIVVDNGAEFIGERIKVKIVEQLQSTKGVMLFAEPLECNM